MAETPAEPLPPLPAFLARVAADPGSWATRLCEDQVWRWQQGERVSVEAYLEHLPGLAAHPEAMLDLIYGEVLLREDRGERPQADEYQRRFPAHADAIARQFAVHGLSRPNGWPVRGEAT